MHADDDRGQLVLAGGAILDLDRLELRRGERTHALSVLEFRFLECLAERGDRVVTVARLYLATYGEQPMYLPDAATLLRKVASRVRPFLGDALVTRRGFGYRLALDLASLPPARATCANCANPVRVLRAA